MLRQARVARIQPGGGARRVQVLGGGVAADGAQVQDRVRREDILGAAGGVLGGAAGEVDGGEVGEVGVEGNVLRGGEDGVVGVEGVFFQEVGGSVRGFGLC